MAYVASAERSRQIIAAACVVLMRDGAAGTSVRAVANEAGIPLGTLQHVFPTKQRLLRAVIEDVVDGIAEVLKASAKLDAGLEEAIRYGVLSFWETLVVGDVRLQLIQYELTVQALRTAGLEDMARWQYERYTDVVAQWLEEAAVRAREKSSVSYRSLARLTVAGVDGLILQFLVDPDPDRGREDVEALIAMIVASADVQPATDS